MDVVPATHHGKLDKRNPVISAFERDVNSFMTLMRRVSSDTRDSNGSFAKGIKILVDIWGKYKRRLPSKFYQERMMQVADFLFGIKVYEVALWQGYSLHLLQYSSVAITDITSVDHFMACFFPEGFDTDEDEFAMKFRAMHSSALCIFKMEERHGVLSQDGSSRLLCVLNFLRITMQALQQHEHLCWQIYNGTLHIYTICRYLMTKNCSAQALEYLLWASISFELSIPLMTANNLPWIVTLYCAVCHCYYDNQALVQAEEFARRALGKINELAKLEEQSEIPATRETQRAYKEASIKLGAMMFKRTVYEARRRPKALVKVKTKNTLRDIPNVSWPRTATERTLVALFDCRAAQFLGVLEALWDSTRQPLQTRMPDEPELQEVILELLSAGISILSGVTTNSEQRPDDLPKLCLSTLTPTSSLIDLAINGENKVAIMSGVRFIKLLFQYKQPNTFTELAKEMLQVLSGVEGLAFRKAEIELALLDRCNSVLSSQRSLPKDNNTSADRHKSPSSQSDEYICLTAFLHTSVCDSAPESQPDKDLVLDVVLFLWGKVKVVLQRDNMKNPEFSHYREKVDAYDKWLWCLYRLCEVAFAYDLATMDCTVVTEMIHTLVIWLECVAEHANQTQHPAAPEAVYDGQTGRSFSLLQSSSTDLLQKVFEVTRRGLHALEKGVATLLPRDSSAITDSAFMQKCCPHPPSTPSLSSPTSSEDGREDDGISKKEKEEMQTTTERVKDSRDKQSTCAYMWVLDLHFEINIIRHRASLKLLQLNAVAESDLLDQMKKNKVSRALFLIQKASLVFNTMETNKSSKTKSLLKEASSLIEKAEVEEKRLYHSTISRTAAENKDKEMKEEVENPPPPPILLSRTDHSLTFAPAPYNQEKQVCWYQLCGRAAEGLNQKVRLGDCSLPGTENMVPAVSGKCVLTVEGLVPNQKYVFAVAAYNNQGKLLGNAIGRTTFPLLASMPVPLLSTWAHLAQVSFQTQQHSLAKRACKELWNHITCPDPCSDSTHDTLATTRLNEQTLQHSSPHLRQLLLTSIFIETEINVQQSSLYCDSFSENGPFIWEQEARLSECERLLVALDLSMFLNDDAAAVQAVVSCYGLLVPLIFHQIPCKPVIQVLKKCLMVLEANSDLLKQKRAGNVSESLMHMIACMTYYITKTSRVLGQYQLALALMDCGRRLLQDVYEAQLQITTTVNEATADHAAAKCGMKISLQLKALQAKNKKRLTPEAAAATGKEIPRPLTGCEDPTLLYDLIHSSTLQDVYDNVMKLRRKAYFTEYAALLLKRTMEEGDPDRVLKWGQNILEFLSRRDASTMLSLRCTESHSHSVQASEENEPPQKKNTPSTDDTRKKIKQKIPYSRILSVTMNRETQTVKKLYAMMSSVAQRHKKQRQMREVCCEERVWKSHLNFSIAQAHIALLYQGLNQLHGGVTRQHHRYSQITPVCFSLAYSGVLVRKKKEQQLSSKCEVVLERDSSRNHVAVKEDVRLDNSITEESCEEGEEPSKAREQQVDENSHTASLMLDSLNKAALHFHRAMVLAHRGSHWTTLQCVCQTVWEQSCRIQTTLHLHPDFPLTAEWLQTTFTRLLSVATDLTMDMLNKLGLWSLYDTELTEELESSLHFSASLDDSTQVDLRWVRTLVLQTLEQLHHSGKWECLAHIALLFNSYTRERYALVITPLLIHAQKRLLERVSCFEGPAVPQPHHVKTQKVTGKEVTDRTYAGCQLLCAGSPHNAQKPHIHKRTHSTPQDAAELKGAEIQLSMSLVCVPLDVEDTLRCYRQALERRPHCIQVLQRSRSLLSLLLAHTQPCFAAHCHSASMEDSSLIPTPNICDLTEEDFCSPNALFSLPISNDHIPTITAAFSTTVRLLQANIHGSLRVQALHELGNLHFYNGNIRAAHSCWSKAVDCALQSSRAVEKWDGASFGSSSLKHTLKQAGMWGCLQAAGLTAKIALHVFTSNVSQRTKCCLLSAFLFKCVLCCSLAQPEDDLRYASHSIGEELLPGLDLFSDPHRAPVGTTVSSLNFICHWLFTTGYFVKLLPVLALYLHFVGAICRDVHRYVEGKILKIRALTELCLFSEAVKEAGQLTKGIGVPLPSGHQDNHQQPVKMFYSNKSLLDNAEAVEELVNCDFAPAVQMLCGPTLCLRYNLARIQLILALSNTVHGPAVTDCRRLADDPSMRRCLVNSENRDVDRLDTECPCLMTEETKVLSLGTKTQLTPQSMKFLLLEGVSSLLHSISEQLTALCCSKMENLELTILSNLHKTNLYLQQGHVALGCEMAVSSMMLLQTSPVIMGGSTADAQRPVTELLHYQTTKEQDLNDCIVSVAPHEDCTRAVEASERIGVCLWLRCRLALVHSLTAHCGTTAPFSGKNINDEAARVLQEGLKECELFEDFNIGAIFMVEAAELEARRGNTDKSMSMLQEAVSVLSEQTCIPSRSNVTLLKATLLLSNLRREQSSPLLQLTQKLLQKQLCLFGERVVLIDGEVSFIPPGPRNIYLPYFRMLEQTAL
uniref:cilia- and flagella-associated protein 54-like isoform X4 n=1 Tax=Solea senegalensis TaxID=28829 RepID=UPI001CD86067|nr:cilia- and flagella-associated protein 54-like isoform X4 [Solea senegalensis]